MRKYLVVGIIVLFIGVGIQPAFAGESIITTLDNEEDCIDCQVTEGYNPIKAKLLLLQVKVVTNILLSSKLGKIPEIKESCQEILDVINENSPLYEPIICIFILAIIIPLGALQMSLNEIWDKLWEINKTLATIFEVTVIYPVIAMFLSVYATGMLLGCWGPPGPG